MDLNRKFLKEKTEMAKIILKIANRTKCGLKLF